MTNHQENFDKFVHLWNRDVVSPLLKNLKLVPGTAEHQNLCSKSLPESNGADSLCEVPLYQPSYPNKNLILKCSMCNVTHDKREDLVSHYSSDWHRYNLQQSRSSLPSASYSQFLERKEESPKEFLDGVSKAKEDDDGSESSGDEDEVKLAKTPRIFFVNGDNRVISVYKTILRNRKTEFCSEMEAVHSIISAPRKLYWVIMLAGGGHFAGAVFKGSDIITHKTFHSYTVRSKQGGTQSGRDNKNATSHPKSAGASLRRYNESAHNQHVQELIEEWKVHISQCDLIFCRWPKSNFQLLFGGQNPLLSKQDPRIRNIPFPTNKPSFEQVKKTHEVLSQILIHEHLDAFLEKERLSRNSSPSKPQGKNKESSNVGETEYDSRQSPCKASQPDCGTAELEAYIEAINMSSSTQRKRAKKKLKNNPKEPVFIPSEPTKVSPNESKGSSIEMKKVENYVYSACRTGNVAKLKEIQDFLENKTESAIGESLPKDIIEAVLAIHSKIDVLSIKFGVDEKSLLHIASENAHKDLIWWLLDQGCDPCVKNSQNQTPYVATKVKEAKKHFQRYVAANPQKYDYGKANIPGPLTEEQENKRKRKEKAKKKQQQEKKQEREKKNKELEDQKRKELEAKQAFLKLSDREKRALAAEKRILAVQSQNVESSSTSRCFHCGKDISQIMPFEYCEFKLCSTNCVKEHRSAGKRS